VQRALNSPFMTKLTAAATPCSHQHRVSSACHTHYGEMKLTRKDQHLMESRVTSIPKTLKGILATTQTQFICQRCDGHNREGGFWEAEPGTGASRWVPPVHLCSYCNWNGEVSFAQHLVDVASDKYTEKLFAFVDKAIERGTDQSFREAMRLICLLHEIYQAAQQAGDEDSRWLREEFMERLLANVNTLSRYRKEVFHEAMAQGSAVTQQTLLDLAERTVEGCAIRREARESQLAIEEKYYQRY
jgi:hypothetical protein